MTDQSDKAHVVLKSVTKGGAMTLASTVVKMGLGFVLEIMIIRYLSQSDFGLYSLSFAFANILAVFCTFGLDVTLPAFVSCQIAQKNFAKARTAFSISLKITTLLSVLALIVLFFSAEWIAGRLDKDGLAGGIRAFAFAIPFMILVNMLTSQLRTIQHVGGKVYFRDILRPLLAIILIALVIIYGLSLKWVIFGCVVSFLVTAAALFAYAGPKIRKAIPAGELTETKTSVLKNLIVFTLPLLGTGLVGQLLMWTDTLIIGWFHPAEVVGLYNGALRITQVTPLILGSAIFLYLPAASRLFSQNDFRAIKTIYSTLTKWVFVLSLPIFLCIFGSSKLLLGRILGEQYVEAGNALKILGFGLLTHVIFGPNIQTIVAMGKPKLNLFCFSSALVANVILDILIVPQYGYLGAAIASCVCMIISNILISGFVFKLSGVHPFSLNYAKVIAASAVMIVSVIILDNAGVIEEHLIVFALCVLLSPSLVFLTGSVGDEDTRLLSTIKKRLTESRRFTARPDDGVTDQDEQG